MSPADVAAIGQRAESALFGLLSHLAMLENTPASRADVLLGRLQHQVDFERVDSALREVEKAAKSHGDLSFGGRDGPVTISGIRDQLRAAIGDAAPYRESERP